MFDFLVIFLVVVCFFPLSFSFYADGIHLSIDTHKKKAEYEKTDMEKERTEQEKAAKEKKRIEQERAGKERKSVEYEKAEMEKKKTEHEKAGKEKKGVELKKDWKEKKRVDCEKSDMEKKTAEEEKAGKEKKRAEQEEAGEERKRVEYKKTAMEKERVEYEKTEIEKKRTGKEKKRTGKEEKEADRDAARQRFEALFAGLDVTARVIDLLWQHEVTCPAALRSATVENLQQLGVSAGQALIIKSKYNTALSAPHSSELAVAKPNDTTNEMTSTIFELDALLRGLKITSKTRGILISHELDTASALRVATSEELMHIGISLGQVCEIKSRFNNSNDGPAAAAVVVPPPQPAALMSEKMPERLFDAATEPPISAKLSPVFGLMDLPVRPLRDTVGPFSSAGVPSVARAVELALYCTAEQVALCACGISFFGFFSPFVAFQCIHYLCHVVAESHAHPT